MEKNYITEEVKQNKHFGHDIAIWENTDFIVNLGEQTADIGDNGGFDDNTPLYCHTCGEELTPEDDQLLRPAIEIARGNI